MEFTRRRPPILLAHSYYLRYDEKQWRRMKPYPPLATLIVAAHLRDQGYAVRLFDAMMSRGVGDFLTLLDETRPEVVALVEDNFNFLTKMCTTRMRDAALEMIGAAKALECRVVVNGSDASDHEAEYLAAGADVVVLGEPEETISAVIESWTGRAATELRDISGLAFLAKNGASAPAVTRTPSRPFLRDLDALPFPAWDLVDAERYRAAWTDAHRRLSWNMVTSRGCPYKCNWCAKPIFGTRYAQRTPADVAEEMRLLRDRVGPDHVWFADDIFGLKAAWIETFAEEVRTRNARIPFMMQSRPNLMKTPVVAALADAGAEEVWMGAESGSQRILDAMDKGTTVDQIRMATANLKAHGIRACWFIQLGYLGEEWDDILLTRDLIRSERPTDIGVSVSYPLPGTKFYELVKEQLGRKTNWQDSDDLAMMFQGTYSTPFYRAIRSLLHEEVDHGPAPAPDVRERLERRWEELAAIAGEQRAGPTDPARAAGA
jgi:anaerobic magnesium-protoporphyrin IX monomethyl ester cyclase